MNKYIKRLIISVKVVALLSISGCTDLLEKPDFLSPDNFYRDGDDFTVAVNGVYQDLSDGWGNLLYARLCFDCILGHSIGYEKEPLNFASGALAPDSWIVNDYWKISYRAINKANNLLERIDDVEFDEELKRRLIGEARFLRGFFFYNLAIYFGDIPVPTESTKRLGEYLGNENGEELAMKQAIEDFKLAAEYLPTSYSGSDLGRATKWAAVGFLSKAYLEVKNYQGAKEAADNLMMNAASNGIFLFDDYSYNFDKIHENQGERIFELQNSFAADPSQNSNIMAHFSPSDWAGPDCNTTAASGWADAWIWGQPEFRKTFDDEDKRIGGIFIEKYCSRNVNAVVTWDIDALSNFVGAGSSERTFRSAFVNKYLEDDIGGWWETGQNFSFLRYADVLLAHSEACNEGDIGDAYEGINMVRERAGLAPLNGLNKEGFRNAIIDERVKEFSFEGQTLPNLSRMGPEYIAEMIAKYTGRQVDGRRDGVIPIPTQEVNANPNLEQNPLWR